jgi:retron-type reverse transcriptase
MSDSTGIIGLFEEVHYETTVPTVSDRIAQMVVKKRLEAVVDPLFLPASYGYRPKKSALDAVGQARQMCWAYDWVCDLDIKGFLDRVPYCPLVTEKATAAHRPL